MSEPRSPRILGDVRVRDGGAIKRGLNVSAFPQLPVVPTPASNEQLPMRETSVVPRGSSLSLGDRGRSLRGATEKLSLPSRWERGLLGTDTDMARPMLLWPSRATSTPLASSSSFSPCHRDTSARSCTTLRSSAKSGGNASRRDLASSRMDPLTVSMSRRVASMSVFRASRCKETLETSRIKAPLTSVSTPESLRFNARTAERA
mmetsp:Transcript_54114/g.144659  ORF Transcript_54114/g.144659 Transcript_54114/m.144659 type:complete len:204 (+) Transcript_54114:459-1070(+)